MCMTINKIWRGPTPPDGSPIPYMIAIGYRTLAYDRANHLISQGRYNEVERPLAGRLDLALKPPERS